MSNKNIFIGNNNPSYNSFGHLSKELQTVDLNNHFILVGDGAGLATGVPIEKTFYHMASKSLRMDYYNLCVIDGGIEALKYNMLSWLHKIGTPKAIIIACKNPNSFLYYDKEEQTFYPYNQILKEKQVEIIDKHANKEFKHEEGMGGYFGSRLMMFKKLVNNCIRIPIIELYWGEPILGIAEKSLLIDCENINDQMISRHLNQKIRRGIRISK